MKIIKLTLARPATGVIWLHAERIIAMQMELGATLVVADAYTGHGIRVIETPEQIIEMLAGAPQLWLWRTRTEARGDHYLAFESEFPTAADGGDPAVLGEPCATAIILSNTEITPPIPAG